MIVEVDLSTDPGTLGVAEAADLERFHVRVSGAVDRPDRSRELDAALRSASAGWMVPPGGIEGAAPGGGDVMIATTWICSERAGQATEWVERFEAMVSYARSKGWTDPNGMAIQGHVEWE